MKKTMTYEIEKIQVPRNYRSRVAEIMKISPNSVSRIANCTTKGYLQREHLKRAIAQVEREIQDALDIKMA
jgi:Mn-dependent DtxR family transcriptional regulator